MLHSYNHSWIDSIELQIAMFGENKYCEKEYYNREINIQELKKIAKTIKAI